MNYKKLIIFIIWPIFFIASDHTAFQVSIDTSSSSQQVVQSSGALALNGLGGDYVQIIRQIIDRMEKVSEITTKKIEEFERRMDVIERQIRYKRSK
jgi:hypothetical protein